MHLITDAYSKKIVGYQLSDNLITDTTAQALQMAIKDRKYSNQLIHHSDRGLHYCSRQYTGILKDNNIQISMTEQSDPYENAVAERVNGILKEEFGLTESFRNQQQLKKQVDQAIELYNDLRPHTSIQFYTPNQAHKQHKIKLKTWKSKKPIEANFNRFK